MSAPAHDRVGAVDYVRRYRLKQLIDELDDAEFNRLVEVLRTSELQFPGWRDRLSPTEANECKAGGQLSFSANLVDVVRGIDLASLGGFELPGKVRAGVWLTTRDGLAVLSGGSDHDAFYFELPATVLVQGTAFVEHADVLHLVETLRKSLPRREQAIARIHVRSVSEGAALEISVGGRGNRITAHPLPTEVPALPPLPLVTSTVLSPAALRDALRVCHGVIDRSYFGKQSEHVNMTREGDLWVLSAQNNRRTHVAQATVEASGCGSEPIPEIHHSVSRRIESALDRGPVELGAITIDGASAVVARGPGWAAWTTRIREPSKRFVFVDRDEQIGITVKRTDLQRIATEAKKIIEAGRIGRNDGILALRAEGNLLRVAAAPESDASFSPTELNATIDPPSEITFHVRVWALLDALAPLRDKWLTFYVVASAESSAILLTTAGFTPSQRPPAAVGFMSARLAE